MSDDTKPTEDKAEEKDEVKATEEKKPETEAKAEEPKAEEPAEPSAEEKQVAAEAKAAKEQAAEESLEAKEIAIPDLRPGMTIRLHQKVKEGEKERIQVFQGIITAMRGKTPVTKTITVQKTSFGVIVEKIFPLASPLIEKIEVVKVAKVRRAKLKYLKNYTKRLKETLVK